MKGHYVSGVTVERVGPTKVQFTCPYGHNSVKDFSKGPVAKRMGSAGVSLMVKYWQDRVTYDCKQCSKTTKEN